MREPIHKWATPSQGSSTGMMWLARIMFFIPPRMFVYGMEMLLDAMRGLQDAGDRGLEVIAGSGPASLVRVPESNHVEGTGDTGNCTTGSVMEESNNSKETTSMDQTLSNDRAKLIRYVISTLKRNYADSDDEDGEKKKGERVLADHTELITDNIDDATYRAWKISDYCHQHGRDEKTDGKSLRVFFEVLDSYEREDLKYEEKQLKVLGEIRDNIGGVRAKI